MAQRHGRVAAGHGELVDRLQGRLHRVDAAFEPRNHLGSQRGDLVASGLSRGEQRLDRHEPRENAVQILHIRRQRGIPADAVGQQRRESRQLVHRSVRLDPLVGLEHPFAADQRGHPLVPCFRIDFHIRKCCFGK